MHFIRIRFEISCSQHLITADMIYTLTCDSFNHKKIASKPTDIFPIWMNTEMELIIHQGKTIFIAKEQQFLCSIVCLTTFKTESGNTIRQFKLLIVNKHPPVIKTQAVLIGHLPEIRIPLSGFFTGDDRKNRTAGRPHYINKIREVEKIIDDLVLRL